MLGAILQDFRYGLRTLAKSPRFAATAVVTLAAGIAANVAIFTFVNAALLRPLPYRESERLMVLMETRAQTVESQFEASYPDFRDWQKQNDVFESLAGYGRESVIFRGEGPPELLQTGHVTDNFFATLGARPMLGRDFRPGEDAPKATRALMLSYRWWQKQFNGRKDVIGQTLSIDNKPAIVAGVLPADFHFAPAGDPDLWMTLNVEGEIAERRNLHWLPVIGRLKPGVSRETAIAGMNVVAERLEQQFQESNRNLRIAVAPLTEAIVGQIRPVLLLLLSAVGLLLLIACANVANLLLARSISRQREMAIRTALGASRWRLARQMLAEGLLLSLSGGALGVLAAQWIVRAFVAAIPPDRLDGMPYLKTMTLNPGVLAFALALALLTGVMFGLAPALQVSRGRVDEALKEGARSSHSGPWRRFASALVISEVAIAMVLMVGAGLLAKSFYRLLQVDPGFNHQNLVTMGLVMPLAGYEDNHPKQVVFYQSLMERLRAVPGLTSVGTTDNLPVGGGNTVNIRVMGQPYTGQGFEANIRDVDANYFRTLQAQLIQGRWFTAADDASAPKRVVVNKTFADMYMKGLDPLAQQVVFTFSPANKPMEVVGVVRDVKEGPLDAPAYPAIYEPYLQSPSVFFNLVVRTGQSPAVAIPEIQTVVRQFNPEALTIRPQTLANRIQASPAAFLHRYPAWLAGTFAAMALLLGTVGLYGLVAYSVSQRTQEIGIRMALGAQRGNILQMVLAQGIRLIVPGIVIGTAAALAAASLVRTLLYGVTGSDPVIFVAVSLLLAAVTLAASFIPARQATKVDPLVALRYE